VKLLNMREGVIDWSRMPAISLGEASGTASSRTLEVGEIQLRPVEYSSGDLADHWCSKGHIVYVVAGELTIEHQNLQTAYKLSSGMSWHTADNEGAPHRVRSDNGATIFILH
jgi:hypothetical protein